MRLDAKRLYFVLCGFVVLALLVLAAGVYVANGLLQQKSRDVYSARLKTLSLEERQNKLRKAKADIEKYKELAEIAKGIVPQDKDQAQTVREISNLATASGVKLGSITFPTSSLGAKSTVKGTTDSQLKPVESISGTYVLNITVQSDSKASASFDSFVSFLESLEQNRRTALVKGVTLTPDAKNPRNLQFTLTLDEYIKP